MARTIGELAREALAVQDAVNLTGVVHSFSKACSDLRACLPDADTRTINTHPIVVLWVDKLCDLSGRCDEFSALARHWVAVRKLSEGP